MSISTRIQLILVVIQRTSLLGLTLKRGFLFFRYHVVGIVDGCFAFLPVTRKLIQIPTILFGRNMASHGRKIGWLVAVIKRIQILFFSFFLYVVGHSLDFFCSYLVIVSIVAVVYEVH